MMDTKINYTLVGIVVLLLGIAGIIFPLWLSSGLNRESYSTYLVYMNEAVDGLSKNAPVKYNGVNVGFVKDIELNLKNTQQVKLILDIQTGTPITTHSVATLRSQGVTGVGYIGLAGGKLDGAMPLTAQPGQPYPVIQAAPSLMVRLDTAVTQLIKNLDTLSQQFSHALNPDNQQLLSAVLRNTNQLSSQRVPQTLDKLQQVLINMQGVTNEIQKNPAVLIRGKDKPLPGPGEEKP